MDELTIGDKIYIPSRRAAEITGYAKDYVGQLCREGRIEARLVGRNWYVLESSIREHRFGAEEGGSLVENVEVATTVPTEPTETWERPTYSVEEAPEIIQELEPVEEAVVEETKTEDEPVAAEASDIQSAWQEWFAREGNKPQETPEEVQEERAPEEVEEVQVRLQRKNIPGSMDIEPAALSREVEMGNIVSERIVAPRKGKQAKKASQKGGRMIPKAIFTAYVLVVVLIVAIGIGMFDASFKVFGSTPILDFIGGMQKVSK